MNRLRQYTERYNDILPLNLVGRIAIGLGVIGLVDGVARNLETEAGFVPLAMIAGGCLVERCTHRPRTEHVSQPLEVPEQI